MDIWHKLTKALDYYRFTIGAFGLVAIMLVVAVGCEPKASSPYTGHKVTQGELRAEVKAATIELEAQAKVLESKYLSELIQLEAKAKAADAHAAAALEEIQRKKEALTVAINSVGSMATAMAGPQYAPLITSAVGVAGILLGIGTTLDSRRKDGVIVQAKEGNPDSA